MGPMTIQEEYRARHPRSAALAERARAAIPGGITHDIRHLAPFPTYIDRASGTRKWDVDGHEYVDYWMGHGALFLGHCHPAVVKAVQEQVARGTHLGASHELEIRWAELVNALVPCAELTRFTMSGTEATHLAMRVARAATGRTKILKLTGHFHGWHDGAVAAVNPPYEVPMSAGIPGSTLDQVVICSPNDIKSVEVALQRGDIAAVILEPAGGQSGTTPTMPGYLQELRALTTRHDVVLIFDEVITGFRYAPGGAQAYFGVTPDLTTLAKIVAGGLPGGALCGRRELMSMLTFRGDPDWDRSQRVAHAGTFNANPLSAAAAAALAGALACGGCVHYPTVMEAGGTMVRPDKGRAVREGAGALVYFDLKSTGKYGDVITGVHTPVARQAQLVSGKGKPLTRLEVPGAAVLSFTPTGPHVVLSELTRPLVLGDTIIVTLVLEKMGGLGVIATVE